MTSTEELKEILVARKPKQVIKPEDLLSSGLTLLNLACTGTPDGCFQKGEYYPLVGKSQAGKTWIVCQAMAEASINPHFKDYRLILDRPERGNKMDMAFYFGEKMARKVEPPSRKGSSRTVEEFYDNLFGLLDDGEPFILGLDSEDALDSEVTIDLREKQKKARRTNKKIPDSYNLPKPRKHSSDLRLAHNRLADTGSILLMVKQVRKNIGMEAVFNPDRKTGGEAITFYATNEIWFSIKQKLKMDFANTKTVYGSILRMQVKKNRMSGFEPVIEVPFYPSSGFDNTGSCVNFLNASRWAKATGEKGLHIADFGGYKGSVEGLIRKIEQENKEQELKDLVTKTWKEIEDSCKVERKQRY